VAILVLVSLILFLPGFFQIPPVDRDEAYFAQATKQMIETGDYVDIRYQDDIRYRKPVGIYWLQAAVVKTAEILRFPDARNTIWLYRIPSLLGAVGAVLATYWCGLAFVSRRGAILAALMMAASTLLGGEARLAKTDAVLLFTIIAAMGVLARAYLSPRDAGSGRLGWVLPAIFWTALGAGQFDDRRSRRGDAVDLRTFRTLAVGVAAARRRGLARSRRLAVVHRDLYARRLRLPG
jgi:4-amino-4-deoxy-L-arabinose transferase-like glycosyltransferase